MLSLYYGRESLDKDKFLFERIGLALKQINIEENRNHRILMLVPDQFTLQAERNAFACLDVPGLIDLEILSQSRLGSKVLAETGGSNRTHIDKYGRHMLLTKILKDENDTLEAFQGMNKKHSFIDMTNNLISEMKQFNASPSVMAEVIDATEEKSILHRKLKDIHKIYTKYEEMTEGKYIDTEDYLNLFISKIGQSDFIKNSEIWVYGFDYFTPKTMDIIEQLIMASENVSIVMTAGSDSEQSEKNIYAKNRDIEIFEMTKSLMQKLESLALKNGVQIQKMEIGEAYRIPVGNGKCEKTKLLAHLEQELYSYPYNRLQSDDDITLCRAANFYAEAETAAAKITELIREEGYRYRDIVVICNDMEARASVIKRVFADYGISAFLDKKRKILHNPVIEYVSTLMDIMVKGWQYEDVFRLIKTDLTPVKADECEVLENYVVKYRIKGNRWKTDFKYGVKDEGENELEKINETRKLIFEYISTFEKEFKKGKTSKEKTTSLYYFLRDEALIPEKIEAMIEDLISENEHEYADETAQIWGVVLDIFDQLIELLGDDNISNEDYGNILKSGFEAVEIGLLPPTIDQIVVGTMQRTRTGNIKALFVIGANDGLLPTAANSESLLSEDEKAVLMSKGIEICKIDDLRAKEEKLAIYKTLSKPTKKLWMSYSASDIEGKESKPSMIFDKIKKIFTGLEISKDILNEEDPMLKIEAPGSTLKHLTEALRNAMEGEPLGEEWKSAYQWYKDYGGNAFRTIEEGISFTNKQNKIEKEIIKKLYQKDGIDELVLSPSRLEKFSRCPFAHLVNYGLRPEERRVFEIAGREIGDVYHQCFMKLSAQLSVPGIEITDPKSPWMNITRDDCQIRINRLIDEAAQDYKEGVLVQGEEEKYRGSRMKEVCGDAAWALVEHVQTGHINNIYFESEFGRAPQKHFPAIEIKLKDQTVYIEGKIDRVDILNGDRDIADEAGTTLGKETNQYVKIIDYKSGKEKFDTDEARKGWRLQLMLYLRAAMADSLKPAGVFYFEIAEPQIDASGITGSDYEEKIKSERKKSFKLDGVILDEPNIIESIAGEFTGYSDIIPVRKNKDGIYVGTTDKKLLNEQEFEELRNTVAETVSSLCGELVDGNISIKPKKVKEETACTFCQYKSICNFDLSFSGCSYDVVK